MSKFLIRYKKVDDKYIEQKRINKTIDRELHKKHNVKILHRESESGVPGLQVVHTTDDVTSVIQQYNEHAFIDYAEEDYERRGFEVTGTEQRVYGVLVGNCYIDLHRFALVYGSGTEEPKQDTESDNRANIHTYFGDDTINVLVKPCSEEYDGNFTIYFTCEPNINEPICFIEVLFCESLNELEIWTDTYDPLIKTGYIRYNTTTKMYQQYDLFTNTWTNIVQSVPISIWYNSGKSNEDASKYPPLEPELNKSYTVGDYAKGAWSGHDGERATWDGATWQFTEWVKWNKLNSAPANVLLEDTYDTFRFKRESTPKNKSYFVTGCEDCDSPTCKYCDIQSRYVLTYATKWIPDYPIVTPYTKTIDNPTVHPDMYEWATHTFHPYGYLYDEHNTSTGKITQKRLGEFHLAYTKLSESSTGDTIIAIIDSGVDYTHPDLADYCIDGYNFVNNTADPMDDNGHGTHVAGIAKNNKSSIMPLKVLNSSGSGYVSNIILAIQYAKTNGVYVCNCSYGGQSYSQAEYDAIAAASPMICVCAAGNSGVNNDTSPHYPAAYQLDNIIAVAAVDNANNLAYFSNYGVESVDLGAPGVNINSTYLGGGYASMSGTSMAAPFVTKACGKYRQSPSKIFNNVTPVSSLTNRVKYGGVVTLSISDKKMDNSDNEIGFSAWKFACNDIDIYVDQVYPLSGSHYFYHWYRTKDIYDTFPEGTDPSTIYPDNPDTPDDNNYLDGVIIQIGNLYMIRNGTSWEYTTVWDKLIEYGEVSSIITSICCDTITISDDLTAVVPSIIGKPIRLVDVDYDNRYPNISQRYEYTATIKEMTAATLVVENIAAVNTTVNNYVTNTIYAHEFNETIDSGDSKVYNIAHQSEIGIFTTKHVSITCDVTSTLYSKDNPEDAWIETSGVHTISFVMDAYSGSSTHTEELYSTTGSTCTISGIGIESGDVNINELESDHVYLEVKLETITSSYKKLEYTVSNIVVKNCLDEVQEDTFQCFPIPKNEETSYKVLIYHAYEE